MKPKLKDILDVLEKLAPSSMAEDWDNPGLQVGDLTQEIEKIFISLDPTLEALREASERKAQLLLTHHPLIFRSLFHLDQKINPGDVIFKAFETGISILSAHTNLDVAVGGINDMLALLFDLQNIRVLQGRDDLRSAGAGLGRIGELTEPLGLSEMAGRVKKVLGVEAVRVVGHGDLKIRTVAVVGGSGGGMVSVAEKAGAQLLITGDIGHHAALEALNLGLALIDGGHFHSEKAALKLFADRIKAVLKELNWHVAVEFYEDDPGPTRLE